MKRVFSILYIICCCTLESVDAQSAGISEVLKELQMENISVAQKQDTITAAFETSVYRGSYNGIGIAIRRLITLPEVSTCSWSYWIMLCRNFVSLCLRS